MFLQMLTFGSHNVRINNYFVAIGSYKNLVAATALIVNQSFS